MNPTSLTVECQGCGRKFSPLRSACPTCGTAISIAQRAEGIGSPPLPRVAVGSIEWVADLAPGKTVELEAAALAAVRPAHLTVLSDPEGVFLRGLRRKGMVPLLPRGTRLPASAFAVTQSVGGELASALEVRDLRGPPTVQPGEIVLLEVENARPSAAPFAARWSGPSVRW